MIQPIQRVNLDLTASMLEELDDDARDLNISRPAVIKSLVRQETLKPAPGASGW